MSLSAHVNHVTLDTAEGQESETNPGFTPKALLTFLTGETAAGWGTGAAVYMNVGAATSATARGAYTSGLVDGAADTGNFRRGFHNDRFMSAVKRPTNTAEADVDLVSMDGSGFTYDIQTAPPSAFIGLYAALGGTEITDATVVEFDVPESTGNFDVTTVGFEPDLVILMANGRINTGFGGGGAFMLGAFNVDNQFAAFGHIQTGGANDSSRVLRTDRCYFLQTPSGGATVAATFVSMLANGFRLNFTDVVDPQNALALCLAGTFQHKIFAVNKTTSGAPVDQDIDVGFTPKFALLASAMRTSGSSQIDHNRIGIGLMDGTRERSYSWQEEDQADPTNVQCRLSTSKAFEVVNNQTATVDASCDHAFTGNNLRLSWDTNDATATQIAGIALGDAPGEPEPPEDTSRSRPALVA